LGTSTENQRYADLRIPHLLATPAAVRFLSVEPMLGPVNLARWLPQVEVIGDDGEVHYRVPADHDVIDQYRRLRAARPDTRYYLRPATEPDEVFHPGPFVDWVIVGGESGPGARIMEREWAEGIVDQCRAAGVPVFVKQLGSVLARELGCVDRKGGKPDEWPESLRVREWPERRA
jgi:protein gp37